MPVAISKIAPGGTPPTFVGISQIAPRGATARVVSISRLKVVVQDSPQIEQYIRYWRDGQWVGYQQSAGLRAAAPAATSAPSGYQEAIYEDGVWVSRMGETDSANNNAAFGMDLDGLTVTLNFDNPVTPPTNLRTVNWGDGMPDATDVAVDQLSHTYAVDGAYYGITATNVAGATYNQQFYIPPTPGSGADKGAVVQFDVFPAEPTLTSNSSTNAQKLLGLGYYPADGSYGAWGMDDYFTIGTYVWNWDYDTTNWKRASQ